MMELNIHHIEIGIRDEVKTLSTFTEKFDFQLIGVRESTLYKQWLIEKGQAKIVLTKLRDINNDNVDDDEIFLPWNLFTASDPGHSGGPGDSTRTCEFLTKCLDLDSVYNVALEVSDVRQCIARIERHNINRSHDVIRQLRTLHHADGEIDVAIVKSCVGNVLHTLLNTSRYNGFFLPGFSQVKAVVNLSNVCDTSAGVSISHIDHIALACDCGRSKEVLDWYEQCFGMRRFFMNRDEDTNDGFVIDADGMGLRLKAFEYWRCSEVGLQSTASMRNSIRFVIAESLYKDGADQVNTFLKEHGGEGVQHIGLHTSDIVDTVGKLKLRGVEFTDPPYTYYTQVGKLQEILDVGENRDLLMSLGILLDSEADARDDSWDNHNRYLMQKFTAPIFDRDTFFMELIQRVGATGFGAGNITALWHSVQAYLKQKCPEQEQH